MENKIKKHYWLAKAEKMTEHGSVLVVNLTDGPHSSPKGVERALKIINGISFLREPNTKFVMVTIEEVPETGEKVNEEAIDDLNEMQSKLMNHGK